MSVVTFNTNCIRKLRKFECQKYRSREATHSTWAGPLLLAGKALKCGVVTIVPWSAETQPVSISSLGHVRALHQLTHIKKTLISFCSVKHTRGHFDCSCQEVCFRVLQTLSVINMSTECHAYYGTRQCVTLLSRTRNSSKSQTCVSNVRFNNIQVASSLQILWPKYLCVFNTPVFMPFVPRSSHRLSTGHCNNVIIYSILYTDFNKSVIQQDTQYLMINFIHNIQ